MGQIENLVNVAANSVPLFLDLVDFRRRGAISATNLDERIRLSSIQILDDQHASHPLSRYELLQFRDTPNASVETAGLPPLLY